MSSSQPIDTSKLQALTTYIDGKIKRYNLMFAVNGAAFALGKILRTPGSEHVLGNLRLSYLAIGCVTFTSIMWFDIWLWGEQMRIDYFHRKKVFQTRGKIILSMLASLLILGWLLAVTSFKVTILVYCALLFGGLLVASQHYFQHKDEGGDTNGTSH